MRALIFDVYNKKESKIIISRVCLVMNPIPGFAPLIGGYIFYWFGWRYIFIIYCLFVVCISIFLFFNLPETSYNYLNNKTPNIKNIFRGYLSVIKNKYFWGYAICYLCFNGVMLGYYAALPFWFIKGYGISSYIYTWLGLISVLFYIVALLVGMRYLKSLKSNQQLMIFILSGLLPIILSFVFQFIGFVNIISIIIVMTLWFICTSCIIVPSNVEATHLFENSKSVVSAVLVCITFVAVGIFSYIEAELNQHKLWQIGLFLSACWLISFLVFNFVVYKKSINQN